MIKNNVLLDLFVTGKEVNLTDGENEVKVWIQKLNPNEHEAVTRKANAARAKALATIKDEESDGYQEIYSEVFDMSKDEMVELIAGDEILEKNVVQAIESEISERPEWTDNDYLQGLRDAWTGGINVKYMEDPEDEEAAPIYAGLKMFAEQVAEEVEKRRKDIETMHLERKIEGLMIDAIKCKIKEQANIEWLKTYRKGQLVYGVRKADKRNEQMLDWQSVDLLQSEAYDRLNDELRNLQVDAVEGKD